MGPNSYMVQPRTLSFFINIKTIDEKTRHVIEETNLPLGSDLTNIKNNMESVMQKFNKAMSVKYK